MDTSTVLEHCGYRCQTRTSHFSFALQNYCVLRQIVGSLLVEFGGGANFVWGGNSTHLGYVISKVFGRVDHSGIRICYNRFHIKANYIGSENIHFIWSSTGPRKKKLQNKRKLRYTRLGYIDNWPVLCNCIDGWLYRLRQSNALTVTTWSLLLFASTTSCNFEIATILRALNLANSWCRAKFCDFAQSKEKAQLWNPLHGLLKCGSR